MPYINQKTREAIDPFLLPLMDELKEHTSGSLSYCIYKMMNDWVTYGGKWTVADYDLHAMVFGAASLAVDEYRRRLIDPYENDKLEVNGDC